MEKAWAIRQFAERFTFSQIRDVKTWSRLPVPINLNGERYKMLVSTDAGAIAYGVFVAVATLAANMPTRGVLADDEGPLSIRRIASRINQPAARVERAIKVLADPEIGWLYEQEVGALRADPPRATSAPPSCYEQPPPALAPRGEEKRREKTPPVAAQRPPRGLATAPRLAWTPESGWQGPDEALRNVWRAAYPACDIDRQLAAMDAWLRANPQRARKSNWARFATSWLAREQDRGGDLRGRAGGSQAARRAATGQGRLAAANAERARLEGTEPVSVTVRQWGADPDPAGAAEAGGQDAG